MGAGPRIESGVKAKQKRIFLSHAAKDKALADKLADLLTSGCAVNPNDILCTSLEGKGIPTGTPSFIEFLHGQIQEPELVILLLSDNFFASHFCLCELGAVWGMELPSFPLVVPPTERGNLKAVLAVAQAGEISNAASLDELRDKVGDQLKSCVPTATWTVKRNAFLNGLEHVMNALEKPAVVPAARLNAAMIEIEGKEKEAKALKAKIADLEKCKDSDQVRGVARKYSSEQEQLEELVGEAKDALHKLRKATQKSIFFELRRMLCGWEGKDEWVDVCEAVAIQEIRRIGETHKPLSGHIRVAKAQESVRELSKFLENGEHADFVAKLESEYEFPMNLSNKEFWNLFFEVTI